MKNQEVDEKDASSIPEKKISSISEEEEEDGKVEDEDENATSNTTTHSRRRYHRKPKFSFYIGGNNGAHIVEEHLTAIGWERIHDKNREDFKLKWCEIKSHNNYHSFREGEQLCYQIPNNKLLTTKIGLLTSLQEYDRVMNKVKKGKPRIMRYQDFLPETYRLDVKDEREIFFENYVDGETWISKPTGLNQGKGIYLIRNREDIARVQEKMADTEEEVQTSRKLPFKIPMARIVQRYVENPLLLDGRKFDVRNYFLIACTNPLVVFYGDGYCRLTCMPYDHNSTDLTGHLTNQFMQKKSPLYEEVKEETVWSMDRFNDYINTNFREKHELVEDWVHVVLRRRCQQVMLHCFQAVRHKLECRLGFFDLMGCDFLVDDNFKISLLEMNCNPALHTNCETLRDVIPDIVGEALKLTLEIHEKANKRERIMPLAAQKNFVLLYNGDVIEAAERRERLQSAAEARRRARSAQRRKRFVPGQYVYRRSIPNCQSSVATATTTTTTAVASNSTSQNSQTSKSNQSSVASTSNVLSVIPMPSTTAPCYRTNLPSSTVTALTTSSQQRVMQSKSTPNVTLKPFYAGGSVTTSRPFSAPRANRKYAQVEPRISTYNAVRSTESPRKDNQNHSLPSSFSKSEPCVDEAKLVSLAPRRDDIYDNTGEEQDISDPSSFDEIVGELSEELEALEHENNFEQILEEDEEDKNDSDDGDDLFVISGLESPEIVRRPSAKLPMNYHYHDIPGNASIVNGISTSKRFSQLGRVSMHKRISRVASLSVKGNLELPQSSYSVPQISPRSLLDPGYKTQYRAPTTVRIRQSLQATTCTLEIGPKSRRGLVAISVGGKVVPPSNEKLNRKLNNLTRLKLINANQKPEIPIDPNSPSALLYLATTHVQHQSNSPVNEVKNSLARPLLPVSNTGEVNLSQRNNQQASLSQVLKHLQTTSKNKLSESSTQTLRPPVSYSGDEKVIWRLRSKNAENHAKNSTDGWNTPNSQSFTKSQKVALKVPVVTQSPGLISPRRLIEATKQGITRSQRKYISSAVTINQSKPRKNAHESKNTENESRENNQEKPCSGESATDAPLIDKPTALSKVVAVATAAPTYHRSFVESKSKLSSSYDEDPQLLTAG